MADTSIGAYDPATARMILDTVKYLRDHGFVTRDELRSPPITESPRVFLAYTTSTITARSGTTAGKGTATLKYIPGVAGTATTIANYAGSAEVTIYNLNESTIASGKYCTIQREYGSGKWIVQLNSKTTFDCSTDDDFVTDVYVLGNALVYDTKCTAENEIIQFTTACPP